MAASAWTWEQSPFGWWEGRLDGFDGTVSVFERMGTWCIRVEISWHGVSDLAHFSEGYNTPVLAKTLAESFAARALRLRQSPKRVPAV